MRIAAVPCFAEARGAGYKRGEMLMDTGWATMPGAAEADRNVAKACMEALAAQL